MLIFFGIIFLFAAAFKSSDENASIIKANELLINNTYIAIKDDNYVAKAYFEVDKKKDYGLKLHLRILNLNDKDIESATIINKKTNSKVDNISIKSFEYVDIILDEITDYDDNLEVEIIDIVYK